MKAEFLNPFLLSIASIIEATISETPQKGKVFLRDKYPYSTGEVAIIVGITGRLSGQVVISMSHECAIGISSAMMMEERKDELDEYAQSALAEMANMIIANATISLADAGYRCDITPPSVITGKELEISCQEHIRTIVIPLELTKGNMEINLSLSEGAGGHIGGK